jgi:SAM-dependent methyltransferase
MHRGWTPLYRLSVGLGVHDLIRHGPSREGAIRIGIPLDPSRYLELPWAERALGARPGERVLDLASPKLLAVALARAGIDVVSVDALPLEIERWRRLAPEVRFEVADGRALPFEDGTFGRAYSISVVEHIPEGGDEEALRELARVVEPGGRILLTVPYAETYREDWRDRPLYADESEGGASRYFFERWYDRARLERLVASAPVCELSRELVRTEPNWSRRYNRSFPWLLPLGPVFGLLGREVRGPGGDIARLVLEASG